MNTATTPTPPTIRCWAITGKNAEQYADKLSDGGKALLAKYPD